MGQVSSKFQIDTLLNAEVNPLFPTINDEGTQLLFTSGQIPQVYLQDISTQEIKQITNEEGGTGAATWMPGEKEIVYVKLADRSLKKIDTFGNSENLLVDRDVYCSNPSFNHEGNLLVFVGRRENQKGRHLFTYDFKYDNLNQLTESQSFFWPKWSPSDELISCHTKTDDKSKIILYHWYGKEYQIIASDTIALRDASWTDSDYKIIYVGETAKQNYLFMSRKDGSENQVLARSSSPIEKPLWIPKTEKIIFLSTNTAGMNVLLQLNLDEQTNLYDVLTKTPYEYE